MVFYKIVFSEVKMVERHWFKEYPDGNALGEEVREETDCLRKTEGDDMGWNSIVQGVLSLSELCVQLTAY